MFTWALTYLVHSTLLIGAVWISSRWIRSAFTRDLLWKLALVGGIVTTAVQLSAPLYRLPSPSRPQQIAVTLANESAVPAENMKSAVTNTRSAAPVRRVVTIDTVRSAALTFWIIGAALLATRIALGWIRLTRLLRNRREILLGDDRDLLDMLQQRSGCDRTVRLTESDRLTTPIATIRAEIVLPRAIFANLSAEQKESILAHELAHVMRRDAAWLTLSEVVRAMLFFQPLNWLIPARLKQTAEFICDDAAVRHTGNRRALAETLATLASNVAAQNSMPVAAMAEAGSNLIARVRRVLSDDPDKPLRVAVRMLVSAGVILIVAGFAPGMSLIESDPIIPAEPLPAVVVKPEPVMQTAAAAVTSVAAPAKRSAAKQKTAQSEPALLKLGSVVLSDTFEGPNGRTKVSLSAVGAELPTDASWIRFTRGDGFVRATEESERGPLRKVEVRPGASGDPVYSYDVNGKPEPWCSDAERVIAANFLKAGAYADIPRQSARQTADAEHLTVVAADRSPQKWHTWNGNVHLTGTRDHEPTEIRIHVVDLQHTDDSRVRFGPSSSVEVEETVGNRKRTFRRTADQILWGRHQWSDGDAVNEEWLVKLLVRHHKIPAALARAIARE